ncbi:MAG TPA: complex I NDUFA9 subunit family protein [Stellaceae bacterium]|nr:complex I NDUFA9 subunit family protein [Stellaceae bacterium]
MSSVRRAVVFGGSGFIGRYVVKRLAAGGAVVAVVARHASRASFLQPMGDVGQIALIDASIGDEKVVARVLDGADTAVNLVGILAEGGGRSFDGVHHEGAERIARLAAAAGVDRLVHVSAIGADPDSPSSYARSKAAGEAAVRAHFPAATILRPSIVFGPEDQFFNRFARMAQLLHVVPLIGGGRTRFQPVYVGDVADAAMAALRLPAAAGATYELGGPRIYSFRELMELMLRQIEAPDSDRMFKEHALISIPFGIASVMGAVAQHLPGAPLTLDQVRLLRRDNVVSAGAAGFAELGIQPTAPELVLPSYLDLYRRGGWYSMRRWAR